MNFTSRHALRGWSSSTWTSLFNRCHSTSAGTGSFTEVIRKHLGGFYKEGGWFHLMNLSGVGKVNLYINLSSFFWGVKIFHLQSHIWGEFLSGFFWGSFPLFFWKKDCNRGSSSRNSLSSCPLNDQSNLPWILTIEALVKISSDWIRCLGRYFIVAAFDGGGVKWNWMLVLVHGIYRDVFKIMDPDTWSDYIYTYIYHVLITLYMNIYIYTYIFACIC